MEEERIDDAEVIEEIKNNFIYEYENEIDYAEEEEIEEAAVKLAALLYDKAKSQGVKFDVDNYIDIAFDIASKNAEAFKKAVDSIVKRNREKELKAWLYKTIRNLNRVIENLENENLLIGEDELEDKFYDIIEEASIKALGEVS